MLKIVESESGLMIIERPVAQWIINTFFSFVLLTVVELHFVYNFPDDFADWLLVFLFGATGVAAAVAAVTTAKTTVFFDGRTVTITRKNLVRTHVAEYRAAIEPYPVFVETTSGTRGSRFFQLMLTTDQGKNVRLTTAVMKDE